MRLRRTRLNVLAAFLVAIVAFVAVGHAGSHLGASTDTGVSCGICADPSTQADSSEHLEHTIVAFENVTEPVFAGAFRCIDVAHAPRGPPAVRA